ncbi:MULTISPECIES: hypothetical protein [unclassified Pseudomonas]|uniref:hypothetical protein n=1 Tax=unclassified Pseudomonas TaxID=196821 RepID=UPI001F42077E|nr:MULTISPECIES: hypothetical protein [unclassified Pseudomonas]MCF5232848.1 hypothetical protein [Pseudomonas sp. PA-5-4H]MCF5235967.1 hypothetical protein [Pseudomonas sp. PA-5-4G]MCF5250115.1 hypothetical protein [Pseudomonas sp. PA-5-4B]MCF5255149.1 hypothetical protein [Pseudomonas sp. PA-5-4B]MCF5261818.1 hypothetical protein [Pseudomonas sp. PA-5-4A]
MSCVPPSCGGGTPPAASKTGSTQTADSAIAKMEATFNMAIDKSAKITEISTAKKAELDATKQRPQN